MADLFTAPRVPRLAVSGSDNHFPVNRIFCVGQNYAAHAAEMGSHVDRTAPIFFTKGHHTVAYSGATIAFPPGTSSYHFEFELVVALGANGFRVNLDEAAAMVFGYASALDMTRRDLQLASKEKGRPWDTAKDVEESCVLTEIIPSADFTLGAQRIHLKVNGETRQDATFEELVWSVPEIIAELSALYHLKAGDVILTGTPAGVGPVAPGDQLEGQIDGLPTLTATVGPAP